MQEPSILAETIEIPVSEFQHVLNSAVDLFNYTAEIARDTGILRGRELAELVVRATADYQGCQIAHREAPAHLCLRSPAPNQALRSPGARPPASPTDQGIIRQAISKIQLRALAIVEHVKVLAEGKEKIAFNSGQARDYLAGREGKSPSRRDTIRALKRAEKICPDLCCDHTPNDGRQAMRLFGKAEDLKDSPIIQKDLDRDRRQRLRMEEARMI